MKLHSLNKNVLNAEDKFDSGRATARVEDSTLRKLSRTDISQLGDIAIQILNDKNLEVSKVRPFFWSLVETYVDRFKVYPFDMNKALFSYLELNNYPEKAMLDLVKQLEVQFELTHGRPLRKLTAIVYQQSLLDDEIKALRDSIKYAAMVAEGEA